MLPAGAIVGQYVVESVLGRGGMAVVYRVRHRSLGSAHALKLLQLSGPDLARRLLLEGRAQAGLRHPNVVAVTDTVDADGQLGLVLEYVSGPTLQQWLATRRASVEQVDALARGVLAGLAAAHARGLVHRDLKPANVLLEVVDGGLVPKIADFGLAKVIAHEGQDASTTRSGVAMGTPAYMAPEQIRDARSADARADVFSAGALLYEIATGRPAFEGEDAWSVFEAIQAGRHRPPAQVRPDLPARMLAAIAGALVTDRDARVPDAAALLATWADGTPLAPAWSPEDLAEIRAATMAPVPVPPSGGTWTGSDAPREPATASPIAPPAPAPPAPSASAPVAPRWIVPAVALGLSAIGIPAGAAAWWWTGRDVAEDGAAPRLGPGTALTAVPDGEFVQAAAISADGDAVAWVYGAELILARDDEERHVSLGGVRGEPVGLTFLPDGDLLLGCFDTADGPLKMSRIDPVARTVEETAWRGLAPTVSPDGRELAYTDLEGVWVVPLGGGPARRVAMVPYPDKNVAIAWSPDARHLAVIVSDFGRGVGQLILADADGDRAVVLREGAELLAGVAPAVAWTDADTLWFTENARPLVQGRVDVASGTLADEGGVTAWTAPPPVTLGVDAARTRLLAIPFETDLDAWVVPVDGSGTGDRVVHDRREEVLIGWVDDRTLLLKARRAEWQLLRWDLSSSTPRRVSIDALHKACVAAGQVVASAGKEAPLSLLVERPEGGWRRVGALERAPDEVVCGAADPRHVWLLREGLEGLGIDRIDLETGAPERVWTAPLGDRPHGYAVSPEGDELVVLTDRDLRRFRAGAPEQVVSHGLLYPKVAVSSVGDAYIAGMEGDTSVVLRVTRDGEVTRTHAFGRQRVLPCLSPDGTRLGLTEFLARGDVWSWPLEAAAP